MPLQTTCGVLVTDGTRLLLGHATRSPRWDIPKGLAEPGELHPDAAIRELREETGLVATPAQLTDLGLHDYLPGKRLALFALPLPTLPDPATLRCTTLVHPPGRAPFPEIDRFALFDWPAALAATGRNMARVLASIGPAALLVAPPQC